MPADSMASIFMLIAMLAIFYFLMIRPESKRKKQAEIPPSLLKPATTGYGWN